MVLTFDTIQSNVYNDVYINIYNNVFFLKKIYIYIVHYIEHTYIEHNTWRQILLPSIRPSGSVLHSLQRKPMCEEYLDTY